MLLGCPIIYRPWQPQSLPQISRLHIIMSLYLVFAHAVQQFLNFQLGYISDSSGHLAQRGPVLEFLTELNIIVIYY